MRKVVRKVSCEHVHFFCGFFWGFWCLSFHIWLWRIRFEGRVIVLLILISKKTFHSLICLVGRTGNIEISIASQNVYGGKTANQPSVYTTIRLHSMDTSKAFDLSLTTRIWVILFWNPHHHHIYMEDKRMWISVETRRPSRKSFITSSVQLISLKPAWTTAYS